MRLSRFLGGLIILATASAEAAAEEGRAGPPAEPAPADSSARSQTQLPNAAPPQEPTPPATPSGPAQSSAAQSGSAQSSAAQSGSAQSSAAQSGSAQSGAAQSTPEMPKPPPCRDADGEQGFPKSTGCSGVFGVRGAVTHLSGVNSPNGAGLMVSAQGEEYIRRGIWSTRDMHRLAIGGGGAGFEGTLLGGWAGGVRIPVGNHHGPVLRAGLFGYLRGNNAFYESLLELPQIQAGYQYLRGGVVLELGATTGAVLTGKSRTGEMTARELGAGFEIGGYAMARTRWFRLGVSAASLPVNDGLPTAVRIAEGTLCALLSPLAICADARGTWTDAVAYAGAAPSEVRSLQAGLTVGFTRE